MPVTCTRDETSVREGRRGRGQGRGLSDGGSALVIYEHFGSGARATVSGQRQEGAWGSWNTGLCRGVFQRQRGDGESGTRADGQGGSGMTLVGTGADDDRGAEDERDGFGKYGRGDERDGRR